MSLWQEIEEGAMALFEEARAARCEVRVWSEVPEDERAVYRALATEVERLAEKITEEANTRAMEAEEALGSVERAMVACIESMEEDLVPIVARSRHVDRADILERAEDALKLARDVRS